jgi:DNA-binding MarR family transcriptional regulator/ribosomal protein S18 acetylase RimI-like enzyme
MHVEQVRSFNRTVTERIGALQDSYLATERPLGADRVLWEIGDGTDLRALRVRLGLDSGYLSRLVGSLQREGLVETTPGEDKRVRAVTLTAAGRAERAALDRRSDELAESLLAPLSETQRQRLVDAMATVERLLTAGLVEIAEEDMASPGAQYCLGEYFKELDARFAGGFQLERSLPTDDAVFLVARLRGEPVGCGAIKVAQSYLKRMWIAPRARGLGLGRRMLSELERRSTTGTARLETNRALTEAIALYRAAGYVEVEPFNDEPYAHHWFEKTL